MRTSELIREYTTKAELNTDPHPTTVNFFNSPLQKTSHQKQLNGETGELKITTLLQVSTQHFTQTYKIILLKITIILQVSI